MTEGIKVMTIVNEVYTMNLAQLKELSEAIATRRKHLGEIKATKLQIGDTVSFKGRTRGPWAGTLTGKIIKCNPTKAKVQVQNPVTGRNCTWTVPYNLLLSTTEINV